MTKTKVELVYIYIYNIQKDIRVLTEKKQEYVVPKERLESFTCENLEDLSSSSSRLTLSFSKESSSNQSQHVYT